MGRPINEPRFKIIIEKQEGIISRVFLNYPNATVEIWDWDDIAYAPQHVLDKARKREEAVEDSDEYWQVF